MMLSKEILLKWHEFRGKIDERIILLFLLVLFLTSFFFFFPVETPSNSPVVKIFKRDGEPLVEIYEEEE